MTEFTRKNVLTFSTLFTPNDGSTTQPGAATTVLVFKGPNGKQTVDLPMTLNLTTGQWAATWDSSACVEGTVSWMVYGYGTLQAATQGEFQINANAANTI